jgi:MFS family permease
VVAGLAVPLADIPINTYMQVSVPDEFRGRVNSVIQMIATGIMPVGIGLGGIVVAQVGVTWTFFIMGGGMAVAALAGLLDPRHRELRMPEPPEVPAGSADSEPEAAAAGPSYAV